MMVRAHLCPCQDDGWNSPIKSMADKLHGLSSSFEMCFLKLNLCNVMLCTQLTSFTMLLYVFFHTYPEV